MPGIVFTVDADGNTTLRGGAQNDSGDQRLHRRRRPEELRARRAASAASSPAQGNPFPQLAIGEYKVITSNYKAEYDQISSAAMTADTKSGTNDFHGEVFGTYTDDNCARDTPSENDADKKTESQEKEYGFAFGGPIIQDVMHFFLTYEAKRFDTPITVDAEGELPRRGLAAARRCRSASSAPPTCRSTKTCISARSTGSRRPRSLRAQRARFARKTSATTSATGAAASASIDTMNNDTRFDAALAAQRPIAGSTSCCSPTKNASTTRRR